MMKKSKYQQNFPCVIVSILVPYAFWFSYQQNVVTIVISAAFRGAALIRGEALIRGTRLFQCGYPKVWRLLEASAYFSSGTYHRTHGNCTRNTRNLRQIHLQNHSDMLEFSDWINFSCSNFQQLFYKKVLKIILCTTFSLDLRTVAINKIRLHTLTLFL